MPTHGPQNTTDAEVRMGVLISASMARLYREQFGRIPRKVRTDWAGPDAVVCALEDTLTPVERNLVQMGEHGRLRDLRTFFQYATVREFCEPIEQITGRKVRAFVSGIDTQADGAATEYFILHPEGYDGPSRIERAEAIGSKHPGGAVEDRAPDTSRQSAPPLPGTVDHTPRGEAVQRRSPVGSL